jgi:hypothetical protein
MQLATGQDWLPSDIEEFTLGGPVLRQGRFNAGADVPAAMSGTYLAGGSSGGDAGARRSAGGIASAAPVSANTPEIKTRFKPLTDVNRP